MQKTILALAAGALLLGCQRVAETTSTEPGNEVPAGVLINEELCFRQVSGRQKQDTAWVRLVINKAQVSGTYWHLPHEKDSRRGTLRGTQAGDLITAMWTFSQEGQTDSLPVQFRLTRNRLQQKPYSYQPNTGRAYLADSSEFTLKYVWLDCAALPILTQRAKE